MDIFANFVRPKVSHHLLEANSKIPLSPSPHKGFFTLVIFKGMYITFATFAMQPDAIRYSDDIHPSAFLSPCLTNSENLVRRMIACLYSDRQTEPMHDVKSGMQIMVVTFQNKR